jgi:hypothetical protein
MVLQNGPALQFSSLKLQKDYKVFNTAELLKKFITIQFASSELQEDIDILAAAKK